MSKTTPVRWWRDDATRYQCRPLIGVCRSPAPGPTWAIELLAGSGPGIAEIHERLRRLQTSAAAALCMPPPIVDDRWGDLAILEGRSVADPAADIRSYLDAERLEIKRRSR